MPEFNGCPWCASEWTDGQFIHMYIHANTTTTTAITARTPTTTTKLRRPWRLSPAAAARRYGRKTFTLRPEQSPVPPCARKCYPGIRARCARLPPMRLSRIRLQQQRRSSTWSLSLPRRRLKLSGRASVFGGHAAPEVEQQAPKPEAQPCNIVRCSCVLSFKV